MRKRLTAPEVNATRARPRQDVGLFLVGRRAYHRHMSTPAIDITKLAPEERLRLIGDLWESLREQPEDVVLTIEQKAELDGRLDALDRGTGDVIPWDEAKRRLRG